MKTFKITETKKKTSKIMAEMKSKFDVWSYYSDEELDKQFPPPKKITTREFQYSVEPDKETLGKSCREADPEMKGITLRERLLMELQYFDETGEHLDVEGVTFCSGSRSSDGNVPSVYWRPVNRWVKVIWCSLDGANPQDGLRSAVSLNSFDSFSLEQHIKEIKKAGYVVYKEM